MIVVLKEGVKEEDIEKVRKKVEELGYQPHVLKGMFRTVINCIGDERGKADNKILEAMDPVEKVLMVLEPYKLASRATNPEGTKVPIGKGVVVGGEKVVVIAGPCSVENEKQIMDVAQKVKEAGAHALRGGAFKPRTAPYSFQGLGKKGLEMLAEAGRRMGLPIVTEVMSPEDVKTVAEYADVLQVGARNVQNFPLLKKLGKTDKPILLKRGLMTNIEEFLLAAEYILAEGNPNVILCERGIRTFETATRYTLDISAIPVLKKKTHLPVIVDPSHATGHSEYVPSMCYAAIAAGADGLLVEVHPNPEEALSDGPQSLKPEKFKEMMEELPKFVEAVGRKL